MSVKRHANMEACPFDRLVLNSGPITLYMFTIFHLGKKPTYFAAVKLFIA